MPSQSTIQGFKGTLDFYYWKGIPCARAWPVYKPRIPHPAEKANQERWAYINALWRTLPANVQDIWRAMAVGSPYTGKDTFVVSYIKGMPNF